MSEVTPDFSHSGTTIDELERFKERAYEARKTLLEGTGAGNDFLGWLRAHKSGSRKDKKRL